MLVLVLSVACSIIIVTIMKYITRSFINFLQKLTPIRFVGNLVEIKFKFH